MQAALEHVNFQIPNEHSRVGYLLTAINWGDAGLQATMASTNNDKTPTGLCNNFEAALSHLLPYDLFPKKHYDCTSGKSNLANISNMTTKRVKVTSLGQRRTLERAEFVFVTISRTSTST